MVRPMPVRALAAAFAVVVGLGALAACGDGGGTSVSSKDAKVKVDKDKVTVETSEGTTSVGQGLPEGFPKDKVPLLDEKVVSGAKGTSGGPFAWTVVMTTSRAVDDLSKDVTQHFAAAGYTAGHTQELGDVNVHQFSNDTYEVGVTIARTGDGVMVTYLVRDKG